VFGKPITPKRLNHLIPHPLTISGTKKWDDPAVRNVLDSKWQLFSAGTHEEPCGYSPGRKKVRSETGEEANPAYDPDADDNESGTDDDETITVTTTEVINSPTGMFDERAEFAYRSEQNVLYVAVWVSKPSQLLDGRIMWPQLEAGA
jgi:hypothetical protein